MLGQALALIQAGRIAEGLRLLEELAAQDNGAALFALADLYWRGAGVSRDFARGREFLARSSDAGDPVGTRCYTNLLASGIAGPRRWSEALARLREEGQDDWLRAQTLDLIEAMALDDEGEPTELPLAKRLSERPEVVLYEAAFTPAECNHLMTIAEWGYEPSTVADGRGGNVLDPIRTSDGSTFHWLIEDPATHALNRRLAALSGTKADQGEPLLVLRYQPGQQYRPHVDWLGAEQSRIKTALVYLNEGYAGGETCFTRTGLSVKGRRGDVLIFRNTVDGERADPLSEHAGLPVTDGTKYLATRWIRAHRHGG